MNKYCVYTNASFNKKKKLAQRKINERVLCIPNTSFIAKSFFCTEKNKIQEN